MSKRIICDILQTVKNCGFEVVGVICDLAGGNRRLLKDLEVDVDKPWFYQGESNVYVFADLPHMIKLLRNNFLDEGFIINGKFVTQSVILKLLNLNPSVLSITQKISTANLSVTGPERQKVKLATKLFSHTIAQAITRAANLGYLEGQNWLACHQLFKLTNDWFDVMNARVPIPDSRTRCHAYGLAFEEQTDILQKNVENDNRIESCRQKHTPTISKSPTPLIEIFFGIIRRKGGLHDHPDRQEFKYRLRSFLLGHNEAAISNNGNIEPDDTPDLEGTHLSLTGTILQQLDVEAPVEATGDEELNVLESDGLEHLAGYICKRLQIAGVESSKYQTFTWVNQLSEGGLVKPTEETMNAITQCERIFKRLNGETISLGENYLAKHLEESRHVNCSEEMKQLFFRGLLTETLCKIVLKGKI